MTVYLNSDKSALKRNLPLSGFLLIVLALITVTPVSGNADWPMWRYDQGRRAFADADIPQNPVLLWTRQLEEPKRCWPFQFEDYFTSGNPDRVGKLSFDISYEPVTGEGKLFVPSMVSDRMTAYSADTGEELWRYYAGGPVRFAPVYNSGRVYFVSDDGYLYCVDAGTGSLLWRYKGSYADRMVLGNERIISMWPARGGPVISGGVIYFAAGVMPFEGVFIHAVDAETGKKIWTNSSSGSMWSLHQHGGAFSYGGPSPQGYLAVSGDKLIVPGGRTPPAVYDKNTGEFLYFNMASGMVGKGAGGYRVFASDEWFFNHGMMYSLDDGAQYGHIPGDVLTGKAFIGLSRDSLIAHSSEIGMVEVEVDDRLQRGAIRKIYEVEELWRTEMSDAERLYFQTSSCFVMSSKGGSTASLAAVTGDGKPGEVVWEHHVDGEIWSMLGGNGKLFVVTTGGKIYCFGEGKEEPARYYGYETVEFRPMADRQSLVASIIRRSGPEGGYALVYGGADIDLVMALAERSSRHFVVIEPDREKAGMLRRRVDRSGIYGRRVSVIDAADSGAPFLPYIYDLIIVQGDDHTPEQAEKIFNSLRPYGGSAYFINASEAVADMLRDGGLVNGVVENDGEFVIITREGPLPGSDQWTHQYGSAANRTYSDDELVKPPLGTLWFGSTSNLNTLPRHHNGPIPQIAGGRLVILGLETISARCIYTGRELWIREIPGIGHAFTDLDLEELFWDGNEVYMSNHPGANFIGSPYVSLEDVVYLIDGERLLTLDSATGEILMELRLPRMEDVEIAEFGHIMVSGDYLITTVDPQIFDEGIPGKEHNWNATSSAMLLVMDRHSGKVLWTKKAETGFRHNAIVAGLDRVYLVDGLSEGVIEILQRRGMDDGPDSRLMALDMETGRELWSVNENVFGTWLGYYADRDILLQGGRLGQRRPPADEPGERLIAHFGSTGEIIWERNQRYSGPLGLHPDMIIPGGPGQAALNPFTGEDIVMEHPFTGEQYRWDWHKYYGCGTMNTSRYLIMFRSGSAGYTDLLNFGGTGNFGGFRAGCTNNMVAAGGVLNAPDYTRTCTCSYPLQTSVGLVHMPGAGVEMWTLNRLEAWNGPLRSLGINFGAQGNRREDGVLWLEYPKIYGAGPDLPVMVEGGSPEWFRNHSTWIRNGDEKYDWVASYGAKGISSISVDLLPEGYPGEKLYNVTLYFAEPEDIGSGDRIFDVIVQGERVLTRFDVAAEAGGPARILRKEFRGVKVADRLTIEFENNINLPVISGVEIIMDDHLAGSVSDQLGGGVK